VGEGFDAELFGLVQGHHDQCCCSVIEA
jgi:hypothetical protein